MKLLSFTFLSLLILTSCGAKEAPLSVSPKTETNTVDIGNKTIITITGSQVQPIR